MHRVGIMQGRLSPPVGGSIQSFPRATWQKEFSLARDCAFSHIEWVFDTDSCKDNPILTDQGLETIASLQRSTGVKILSVCGDYFRDFPIFRIDSTSFKKRINIFSKLARSCEKLGVEYIMIPFVDNFAIKSKGEFEEVIVALQSC